MNRILRISISVAVLGLAGWYVATHAPAFAALRSFDWAYLPALSALVILSIAINGQVLIATVQPFGIRLRWQEWFGLTAIGSMSNYAPLPQAGPAARALYLKKVHGLAFSSYAACVLVVYALALAVQGVLGLLGITAIADDLAVFPWPLLLIFVASVVFCLVALLAPGRLPEIGQPIAARFQQGLRRMHARMTLTRITGLLLAQTTVATASLYVTFAAIHQPVGPTSSLLLSVMILNSGIFNVTPGNIGVAESAAWLTASLLGGNGDLAIVAYAAYRAVSVAILFTLGPIFTFVLSVPRPNPDAGHETELQPQNGGIQC